MHVYKLYNYITLNNIRILNNTIIQAKYILYIYTYQLYMLHICKSQKGAESFEQLCLAIPSTAGIWNYK